MKPKNRTSFIKLFALPELLFLLGKKLSNLIILISIFTFSLLAIGIGNGVLAYLKIKMDNPYIKFLTVVKDRSVKDVDINYFQDSSLMVDYGYTEVTPYYNGYANFRIAKNSIDGNLGLTYRSAFYRLINSNEEFFKFLMKEQELNLSGSSFNDNKVGIIVTNRFLKKLGVKKEAPYLYYYKMINGVDCTIPIPVMGVVSQLPEQLDMLVSEKLYDSFKD